MFSFHCISMCCLSLWRTTWYMLSLGLVQINHYARPLLEPASTYNGIPTTNTLHPSCDPWCVFHICESNLMSKILSIKKTTGIFQNAMIYAYRIILIITRIIIIIKIIITRTNNNDGKYYTYKCGFIHLDDVSDGFHWYFCMIHV